MIDLHTHSAASDGSLSPAELIRTAAGKGLRAVALTDHDTIEGLEEAEGAAARAGIRLIPGVEVAIRWSDASGTGPPGEFHLLGLGLKTPSPAFLEALAGLSRLREARNREILDRINKTGIDAEYDELRSLSGGGSLGRPHFAALLVKRGLVKNPAQAFDRYLGKGKPFYVPKDGLDFTEALGLIRESGGISVLAHPMSLYIAWGSLPAFVQELARRGLDGIEAWHPTAGVRSCKRLEELGRSLGLAVTAGSDFHGEHRPDRKLGFTAGGRRIEDAVLEAIPALGDYHHSA
ncbi:MAG: PHP domain-containing protein [Treponema sp.]|jgi:predicted metal-dependent phosphoesterase TrpH|nr:PHP domain-containing protein [Treponema sp.]